MTHHSGRLVLVLSGLLLTTIASPAQQRCDDPNAGQWVKDVHGWVTSFDELGVYAIENYGAPATCTGEVTAEFDGNDFGRLRLEFEDGAAFELQTYPPEMSVATLTDSSGFDDESALREVLEIYTADIGLSIDWKSPVVETIDGRTIVTYWDPEEGLNASARLVFRDELLISVSVGLAL